MSTYGPESTVADVLSDPEAQALVEQRLPGIFAEPELALAPFTTLDALPRFLRSVGDPAVDLTELWVELAALPGRPAPDLPAPGPLADASGAAPGSAQLVELAAGEQWGITELAWAGPSAGTPFVEVDLEVRFTGDAEEISVRGFYDGAGIYRVRFSAPRPGLWAYATRSNVGALDGLSGTVEVAERAATNHGRVVVRDRWHFAYADGTPYLPLGTTAYAWTHQPAALQEQTLATLARAGFPKLRMCVFPKSYHYNSADPVGYPYERDADGGWDFTRFVVGFFQALERRIAQLGELGIEADLILFHPYDRWGFSRMPVWADRLYTAYVVRRLAAYRNVWWALANEFDFMPAKTESDWEGIAAVIQREDHVGHLTSIHNGFLFYDHTRPWVTHCSIQSGAAESIGAWRERYGKPVVLDEAGYEGDFEYGWGNLSAEELVRRSWEAAVRGGYLNHGETFHEEGELVWWSKGGELRGESAERFRFLASLIAEAPTGRWEPLVSDFDVPCGGDDDHRLLYFGAARPYRRTLNTPPGAWSIDVIDTWAMTVDPLPGTHTGRIAVPLSGRPYQAIRLRRVEPTPNS